MDAEGPAAPGASARDDELREAVRRGEERYRELWENANDILYLHDLEGRFLDVNAMAVRTYGYTREEFLRLSIRDLVDPAHLATAARHMAAKASGTAESSAPYELLTRARDGRAVWAEVATRVVRERGRPAAIQGIVRDVTARREAEERFRSVFDGVPVGLFRSSPEGRILEANEALVRMLGLPDRASLLEHSVQELYGDPAERPRILQAARDAPPGQPATFEARFRRHDGSLGWSRGSIRAIPAPDGSVLFYEGHIEDISAQRQAEEGIRTAQGLAREMEEAPDFPAAVGAALRGIGRLTGWAYGEAWMRQPAGSRITVIEEWWGERTPALQKFRHLTRGFGLEPNQGLAGRAWGSGETVWKDPLDRFVVRAAPAAAAGLCSAVAIPVGDPGRPVAVLAFFHAGSLDRARWGPVVEAVVAGLRRVAQRRAGEDRVSSRLAILEAHLESSPDAVLIVAADGEVLAANGKLVAMLGESRQPGAPLADGPLSGLPDPARFVEKVRQVYEDRRPRFVLGGRAYERRDGGTIDGGDGRRIGRIVTFREAASLPGAYQVV